ncbi:hypothetical protein HMSSN139_06370 [Paenibacillus sp. HMSSN-139]|nr:hypothetical protein HMSSN139_06370 [Paenibacillus sp. HMSSN-139]
MTAVIEKLTEEKAIELALEIERTEAALKANESELEGLCG